MKSKCCKASVSKEECISFATLQFVEVHRCSKCLQLCQVIATDRSGKKKNILKKS